MGKVDQHGGSKPTRNPKRTAGLGTTSASVNNHGGVKGNRNAKRYAGTGKKAVSGIKSGRKFAFKNSKGLKDFGGVSQYGGSNNNENPFQIN